MVLELAAEVHIAVGRALAWTYEKVWSLRKLRYFDHRFDYLRGPHYVNWQERGILGARQSRNVARCWISAVETVSTLRITTRRAPHMLTGLIWMTALSVWPSEEMERATPPSLSAMSLAWGFQGETTMWCSSSLHCTSFLKKDALHYCQRSWPASSRMVSSSARPLFPENRCRRFSLFTSSKSTCGSLIGEKGVSSLILSVGAMPHKFRSFIRLSSG